MSSQLLNLVVDAHPRDVLSHLYTLYLGQSLCDTIIVAHDNAIFHAHRVVLSAASRFLHKVFADSPGVSNIKLEMSSQVLNLLLSFCYTGEISISPTFWNEIKQTASILQMNSLMELLTEYNRTSDISNDNTMQPVPSQEIFWEITVPTSICDNGPFIPNTDVVSSVEVNANKEDITSINLSTEELPITNAVSNLPGLVNTPSVHRKSARLREKKESIVVQNMCDSRNMCQEKSLLSSLNISGQSKTKSQGCRSEIMTGTYDENKGKNTCECFKARVRKTKEKVHKEKVMNTCKSKVKKLTLGSLSSTMYDVHSGFTSSAVCRFSFYVPRKHIFSCTICGKVCYSYLMFNNHRTVHELHLLVNKLRYQFIKSKTKNLKLKRQQRVSNKQSWFQFVLDKMRQKNIVTALAKSKKLLQNNQMNISNHYKLLEGFPKSSMVMRKSGKKNERQRVLTQKGQQKQCSDRKRLFSCTKCPRNAASLVGLHKHLQIVHGHTSEEADRLQHVLPHSLTCEDSTCSFSSSDLHIMEKHVDQNHPDILYICSLCPQTFLVKLSLERHTDESHRSEKIQPFCCATCGQLFKKRYTLLRHEFWKHGIDNPNVKVYHCPEEGCGYKTSASSSIKAHRTRHCTEKLFSCQYCGLKLKTEGSYKKHVNKMHLGIRPYLCQVCGQNFGEEHELRSHISNRHSVEKKYQCSYCPYRTAVKGTFYTHMFNVHNVKAEKDKRNVFTCPHCPFTSLLSHRFKTHLNGHTNTRTYECTFCNKTFISSSSLRTHKQWLHSDQQLTCSQCDYKTKTIQKLNEHIRVQHQLKGFKPYKCPYCEFRCATGGNTRKHVQQVHRGEIVKYIRDDNLLKAARMARACGDFSPLCSAGQEEVGTKMDIERVLKMKYEKE